MTVDAAPATIGQAATAATAAEQDVGARVAAYVQHAREAAKGGLTLAEFFELVVSLVRLAMSLVAVFPAEGAAKRQFVLDATGHLFDAVADLCVPAWLWPAWMVGRPFARTVVLALAAGAVESLLPTIRSPAT